MTRESCISHRPRQAIAVIRQDYYELMDNDATGAAILNLFEYWSNSEIAKYPDVNDPWVGERTIKEFERMLIGLCTDKQIRIRLAILKKRGFIETRQNQPHRKTLEYRFFIGRVQVELDNLNRQNPDSVSQMTVGSEQSQRSNDRWVNGHLTVGSEQSQRSNDRCTIYKNIDPDQKEYKESLSLTLSLEPQPEPERERILKIEEKPKTEEATNGKPELADLVAQLPKQEREPFLDYAIKTAAELPKHPVMFESWAAAKFTELRKQFLNSSAAADAKAQAIVQQYNFASLPNLPEVLTAAFHGGGPWVQEIEAQREWRMAFLRWARKSGAFEALEAAI